MKKTLSSIILKLMLSLGLLPSSTAIATPSSQINEIERKAIIYSTNALIQGSICALTAAIQQRPILKDTTNCIFGGIIQDLGIELATCTIPKVPGIGMRVTETGTSIINNTLAGEKPFQELQYGYGPLLFTYNTNSQSVNLEWRLAPTITIGYFLAKGYTLDLNDSLRYQAIVFQDRTSNPKYIGGSTLGETFYYSTKYPKTAHHEFLHVLQYVRFRPAELLVPNWEWKKKLKLRLGEDIISILMTGTLIPCRTSGDRICDTEPYALPEKEAYELYNYNENK